MSINSLLNLSKSLSVTNYFKIPIEELESLRLKEPERFIDVIQEFIKNSENFSDYVNLKEKLKLSSEEEFKLMERLFQTLTNIEQQKVRVMLLSNLQKDLFYLVESGKLGISELHQIPTIERQEILGNLIFTDDEINILVKIFYYKQPLLNEPLLSSIQWKLSGWQKLGLITPKPEIRGEELLILALEKIKTEKRIRKPSDLERYVIPRIKKVFPKKLKAFTDEELKKGVMWYLEISKKNAIEKDKLDHRSRSRVNVTKKQWNDFLLGSVDIWYKLTKCQ